MEFAHANITFGGSSSSFYLEGGAIHPDTQFCWNSTPRNTGHDQLTPLYSLLHWGDYAVSVADAIRAAAIEHTSPAD